jgi:hypothetical protein
MVQQYFDPLGETETSNRVYALTVRFPAPPPHKWLPSFVTCRPVKYQASGYMHIIEPDDTKSNFDCYKEKHLDKMKTKVVKMERAAFPFEMRCHHLRHDTTCLIGCYVLERGGSNSKWQCKRIDCEGHVYCSPVKADKERSLVSGRRGKGWFALIRIDVVFSPFGSFDTP